MKINPYDVCFSLILNPSVVFNPIVNFLETTYFLKKGNICSSCKRLCRPYRVFNRWHYSRFFVMSSLVQLYSLYKQEVFQGNRMSCTPPFCCLVDLKHRFFLWTLGKTLIFVSWVFMSRFHKKKGLYLPSVFKTNT